MEARFRHRDENGNVLEEGVAQGERVDTYLVCYHLPRALAVMNGETVEIALEWDEERP